MANGMLIAVIMIVALQVLAHLWAQKSMPPILKTKESRRKSNMSLLKLYFGDSWKSLVPKEEHILFLEYRKGVRIQSILGLIAIFLFILKRIIFGTQG